MKKVGSVKNLKKKEGAQLIRRGKHIIILNKKNRNFRAKQ